MVLKTKNRIGKNPSSLFLPWILGRISLHKAPFSLENFWRIFMDFKRNRKFKPWNYSRIFPQLSSFKIIPTIYSIYSNDTCENLDGSAQPRLYYLCRVINIKFFPRGEGGRGEDGDILYERCVRSSPHRGAFARF